MAHPDLTILSICQSIAATFRETRQFQQVQSPDGLTESIPDWPMIQIYPEEGGGSNGKDRVTFSRGVIQTDLSLVLDVYARPRSEIPDDMRATIEALDKVENILGVQGIPDHFHVPQIKSMSWEWARVTLTVGTTQYAGLRYMLRLTIF